MTIKTIKRKLNQRPRQQKLTPDELLFRDIKKTFRITKESGLGPALSIYLAMVGLRTGALAHTYDKEKDIIDFFTRHQKAYPSYYSIHRQPKPFTQMMTVFISKQPIPDNLIIIKKNINGGFHFNTLELGRFLGYPCPRDFSIRADDMKKKIVFYINVITNDGAKKKLRVNRVRTSKLNKHVIGMDIIFTSVCLADETNFVAVQKQLQEFCAKVNDYCRSRFTNLLPGLRVYLEHKFLEPISKSDSE